MVKKLLALMIALVFVLSLSTPLAAQKTATKKQDRWEGMVTIINKDKMTIVVRKQGGDDTRTISYSASTAFNTQEHGKKPNAIDASQIKEGDRVICVGTWGKDGVLQATLVSKRMTENSKMP